MGGKSKIEWTDATWNPVTGCSPVSAGCDNCYAARMVKRFPHLHDARKQRAVPLTIHPKGFWNIQFHPSRLDQPLRWKRPRRIFVCSMGDLFNEEVKDEWIDKVIGATRHAPQHTFMILTKRPGRMRTYFSDSPGVAMVRANREAQNMSKPRNFICPESPSVWPRHNLWLGVTAENQEMADLRIPFLLQTPAAKRFVSVEPMLGSVRLGSLWWNAKISGGGAPWAIDSLDWVIAGCESGPRRRPCNIEWLRSLRDQCVAAGVPFFLKQMDINGRLVKMPILDGRVWAQVPEGKG